MPGDPAGGMLARLNPAQIQSNPGIIETYRRMLDERLDRFEQLLERTKGAPQ